MGLVALTGRLVDSGGNLLNGELWVILDSPLLVDEDTEPDTTIVPRLFKFPITAGVIDIELYESETDRVTYWFRFYASEGDELDNDPSLDFHAFVPNLGSVDFADLVPTGVTTDRLDTAIARLARILATTSAYVAALRGGPNWLGEYDAGIYYQEQDAVSYGGSSWLYINVDPAIGETPSVLNTDFWALIAEKGEPGGTGGAAGAYDATGWNGDTNAPTKDAIRDLVETDLATLADLAGFAPLAGPTFTGGVVVPALAYPAGGASVIATPAGYVDTNFAPLFSPALTGLPSAPTQTFGDSTTRLATTAFVQAAQVFKLLVNAYRGGTDQTITDNTLTICIFNTVGVNIGGAYNTGTGVFTVPTTKRLEVAGFVGLETDWASGIFGLRVSVFRNGAEFGRMVSQSYNSISGAKVIVPFYFEEAFTAGQTLDIRIIAARNGSGTFTRLINSTAVRQTQLIIKEISN